MNQGLSALLRKTGLKATPARLSILSVFSDGCKPVNAEYIEAGLKGKGVNRVTVYRTLGSFEKAGLIRVVDLRRGSAFYERAGYHHHHLVCVKCGRTEGFAGCGIEAISKRVLKKSSSFYSVSEHSLELFGLCRPCAKSGA